MAGVKLWVKFLMFISSFSPLIIIWGFKFKDTLLFWKLSIFHVTLIISLISIIFLISIIESSRRDNNPQRLRISSIEDLNKVHIEYLLTYVFVFLPTTNISIFSFSVFMVVLLIIYLRSNLIYVNPVLSLLFYDVVKVKGDKDEVILITRRKDNLIRNENIKISILSKGVFVETKENGR